MKALMITLILAATSTWATDKTCEVVMKDSLNKHTATLTATKLEQKNIYRITDHSLLTDGKAWVEDVKISNNKVVPLNAGTPSNFSIEHLNSYYKMRNDEQLSFYTKVGTCKDETLTSLIYFLIMEWFYFG